MEKNDIPKAILSDKPVKMFKMPKHPHLVIGKDSRYKYYITPITEVEHHNIKEQFKSKDGFIVRTGNFVIGSQDIVLFGKPFENAWAVEHKIESIIPDSPLAIPTPIDEKNMLVGNKLNTGPTRMSAFRYYVCLIGKPEYILMFRSW